MENKMNTTKRKEEKYRAKRTTGLGSLEPDNLVTYE